MKLLIMESLHSPATSSVLGPNFLISTSFSKTDKLFFLVGRTSLVRCTSQFLEKYRPALFSGRGVKLTTHLHLTPRSITRGAIPPLPQYVFMAQCLVKHRDNFTWQ